MRTRVGHPRLALRYQNKNSRECKDNEGEDKCIEHGHLHVVGLNLLAQILRCSTDHQAGNEHRQNNKNQHPVHACANAAKDHLTEHDVDQRDHAAEGSEAVVHAIDRAATGIGRDCREERAFGDSVADFFAFHVAAGAVAVRVCCAPWIML